MHAFLRIQPKLPMNKAESFLRCSIVDRSNTVRVFLTNEKPLQCCQRAIRVALSLIKKVTTTAGWSDWSLRSSWAIDKHALRTSLSGTFIQTSGSGNVSG